LRDAQQLYNNERSYAWSVSFSKPSDLKSTALPTLKGIKHSLFVESRLARPAFQPPFNASVPQKLHIDMFTPSMSLEEQLAAAKSHEEQLTAAAATVAGAADTIAMVLGRLGGPRSTN